MKPSEIRLLAERHTQDELLAADVALVQGLEPSIEIPGDTPGERLTHAYAAWWVRAQTDSGLSLPMAMRAFALRVRTAIGQADHT